MKKFLLALTLALAVALLSGCTPLTVAGTYSNTSGGPKYRIVLNEDHTFVYTVTYSFNSIGYRYWGTYTVGNHEIILTANKGGYFNKIASATEETAPACRYVWPFTYSDEHVDEHTLYRMDSPANLPQIPGDMISWYFYREW